MRRHCSIRFNGDWSLDGVLFEFERREIQFKSEEQLAKIVDLAVELANNNRLQENRGHTPNELFKLHESANIIKK